jgi:para-nitrobenzyl esterase
MLVAFAIAVGGGVSAVLAVGSPANSAAAVDPPQCSAGTTVTIDAGPVCGTTANGVTSYLGVRYAAPPVGTLRFHSPQPVTPWTTTFNATTQGNACPSPGGPTNEDCLNLNVRVPANPGGAPMPVMVEIHGGGFLSLSPQDTSTLASQGHVITVEVNYRLGIFGFLANAGFGAHAGDYGIQDEQAALRWVHTNIAKLGGDPHNVTLFGQSAGGSSVCDNSVSPTAAGLFQKGISESGYYNSLLGANTSWQPQDCRVDLPTEQEANRAGARFAAAVGCPDQASVVQCLQNVPVQKLLAQGGLGPDGGTLAPIINGTTLTMSPGRAFAKGQINNVSLMIGVSRDEVQLTVANTPDQYRTLVEQQYGRLASTVMARYPLERYPNSSPFIAYRTIIADSTAVCPMLANDEHLAKHIRVFAWEIDNADTPTSVVVDATKPNGAFHVSETGLLFPIGRYAPPAPLDPNQAAYASQLIAQWSGFARTGNPTVPGTPYWSAFTKSNPMVMSLQPAGDSALTPLRTMHQQHNCDFWDSVTPRPQH